MKAFSPNIFTEQATSEIIKESNSIVKPAEKSLIAFKTDCINKEIAIRRKVYKDYITESSPNIVIEKLLMDMEIQSIRESYEEYAKTHTAKSPLLENTLLGIADGDEELDLDECFEAFELEVAELTFRALQEEARVFAESISDAEKFAKLQAIDEDFKSKVKLGWIKTVNLFKQIFAKFIEKLRANITTTKNYMERYKKIILEKPFHNDEYKTQDLVLAYNRILGEGTKIPFINLESMTDVLDDNTKAEFLKKYKNEIFSKMEPVDEKMFNSFEQDKTQSAFNEFLKTYFCMQGHEEKGIYHGPQFQELLKSTFYDFMCDARKAEQTIKKNIKTIEDACNTIMKSAGIDPEGTTKTTEPATSTTATPATPAATPAPTGGESAYSQIFQANIMLENGSIIIMEDEAVKITNAEDTSNGNQQQSNNKNTPNGVDWKKEEVEKNKEVAKKGSAAVIPNRCKNYADACCGILRAKLSAIEFVRSVIMKIVRDHVQKYIGGSATPTEEKQQNKPAPPAKEVKGRKR